MPDETKATDETKVAPTPEEPSTVTTAPADHRPRAKSGKLLPKPPEDRPWERDDPDEVFYITSWNGVPLYQCRECAYNSTDGARERGAQKVIQHYYKKHAPEEETAAELVGGPPPRG